MAVWYYGQPQDLSGESIAEVITVTGSAHAARSAMLSYDDESAEALDQKVLTVLPVGVDLDLAQVTSLAKVMPTQAQSSLDRLVQEHDVEIVLELAVAGRPRYRRVSET
jgi:hypothetical protein